MSSLADKILALARQTGNQKDSPRKQNYNINSDDELANASKRSTSSQKSMRICSIIIQENGMALTENSTTIDIKNCDKSENGNENVDEENQMSYVENIIMIGTSEYSAANGIENCGDDESEVKG
ncbi:hypothetical protein HHI36_015126 [Cryptolaemus montrouzieri]|uniref:Uncharacterized protein n=1 Tax=Cryptolaemus montrouzieri TaxID=559131 RepID=A0ABD2N4N9_9CUCU